MSVSAEVERVGALLDDPRKSEYLAWLLMPKTQRDPATQDGIAKKIGVSPRTLRDWNQQEDFRRVWRAEQQLMQGSIEKVQDVLDALHAKATDPTARDMVSAAKLWLDTVGYTSQAASDNASKAVPLSELPTERLLAALEVVASRALAARDRGLPSGVVIEASVSDG